MLAGRVLMACPMWHVAMLWSTSHCKVNHFSIEHQVNRSILSVAGFAPERFLMEANHHGKYSTGLRECLRQNKRKLRDGNVHKIPLTASPHPWLLDDEREYDILFRHAGSISGHDGIPIIRFTRKILLNKVYNTLRNPFSHTIARPFLF